MLTHELDIILSDWQSMSLPTQPTLIQTFNNGLNHQCYLLSAADQLFVLKIFSTSNKAAVFAQQFASGHGISPKIISSNQNYSIVVMQYVPNGALADGSITSSRLVALAKSLQKLHSIPTKLISHAVGQFELIANCEKYLKQIDSKDNTANLIHKKLMPALEGFVNDTTPTCFCHNDLVTDNVFIVEDQAQLIDWEYAQINNPWFDIAAIIYYLKLDEQQANIFIQQYHPDWLTLVSTPIYYGSQIAVLWLDMLWHVAQGGWQCWPDLNDKLIELKRLSKKWDIAL